MSPRNFSLRDRLLSELDAALRIVAAKPHARRRAPEPALNPDLNATDRFLSAALMRVNHSGEIAAQALYRGQALVARDEVLREELLQSADEEHDHLAWCRDRATALGGRTSLLAPAWYAGSFAIGILAGLTGDKTSLGFLAETERQVEQHLDGHLERLPADDHASRAILEQMRADEIRHAEGARERGGIDLPRPVKRAMRAVSNIMTTVSFRI